MQGLHMPGATTAALSHGLAKFERGGDTEPPTGLGTLCTTRERYVRSAPAYKGKTLDRYTALGTGTTS